MLAPKMEARIVQALNLKKSDKMLEIGTGSGYLTALLASLAGHVTSVEIKPTLSAIAKIRLDAHHINNVDCLVGDASAGWAQGTSYDVIVFGGSLPTAPTSVAQQLKVGGRLVIPVGDHFQELKVVTRTAEGYREEINASVRFVPMTGRAQHERDGKP